jgi:dTDP-glucose pyrophosphorylase/CBS domain-containing protein
MPYSFEQHYIDSNSQAREALRKLDALPELTSRTLFVLDEKKKLLGTITDGDIRRGLLRNLEISDNVTGFMHVNFKRIVNKPSNPEELKAYRNADIRMIPVVDESDVLLNIIDLDKLRTILPVTAVIMAGGKGERLRPLTDTVPKPMLKIGDKPIIEHNIDRLIQYGIKEIFISINYLGDQIKDYFGDGSSKGISIRYIEETTPLGTIGSISMLPAIANDVILLLNSDLLTNLDFEMFYEEFQSKKAVMTVASIPYQFQVPYAVLETKEEIVHSFLEKPSFTYYSNAGIYLIAKTICDKYIPRNSFYNTTDLMEEVIKSNDNLTHYPHMGYWLDIGKYPDFIKAQEDIKYIKL